MRLFILIILTGLALRATGQQTIHFRITDQNTGFPLEASLLADNPPLSGRSDSTGIISISFPANGSFSIVVTSVGYEPSVSIIAIPSPSDTIGIGLARSEEEMEEIIIQSTRTSRNIANVPTRVETIEMEEIDEKNNMRPANVAMLLHESTGIQVQQTSATSGNASIRIQGLDGRYTQLLKDGFPNFGNFSSGLSVLEIPPLDLKQVEIIKGPASPLFGGGAIAGVVNFISRTPGDEPEYNFIINHSSLAQSNLGGFASGRNKKTGYTVLALYNRQRAVDVDKDDFTELPESREYTIHPKLFLYLGPGTTIQLGNSFTRGERSGGDIHVIRNGADAMHQYFEKNRTTRNISSFELTRTTRNAGRLVAKQSFSIFDRSISTPGHNFKGIDHNAYTDISYVRNSRRHALVAGGTFVYNNFREKNGDRDNRTSTGGLYLQHTLDASEAIKLETGLRVDLAHYSNSIFSNTEFFALPRVSLLVRYGPNWTSRIGGGMGYKAPTLFTEETETIQYRNVQQLEEVKSEKSYGGTADVNFRTHISPKLSFSFNHMFFYTIIDRPLVLEDDGSGKLFFMNAPKPVVSRGFETNARIIFRDKFKLFLGYTFTHAEARHRAGQQFLPLVPKHKLNSALIYEKENSIKLGLEGYFTGRQHLSNGDMAPGFEELGFMAEKIFRKFSIYVNFENFTDTRQGRYKNVVNGSHLDPAFDEIWTHTEGFVFNGGVKIKL